MGYDFSVMDPNIDEKSIRDNDPQQLVLKLALAKAEALLPKISTPALLITADQIVKCNHTILEKPRDFTEACDFLRLHSIYPAETISAIVVTNTQTKKQESGISIARVFFRPIPENMISIIANQDYVLHCAGGFSLDDPLLKNYIAKIEGTEDSVTGLPIELTQELLTKAK